MLTLIWKNCVTQNKSYSKEISQFLNLTCYWTHWHGWYINCLKHCFEWYLYLYIIRFLCGSLLYFSLINQTVLSFLHRWLLVITLYLGVIMSDLVSKHLQIRNVYFELTSLFIKYISLPQVLSVHRFYQWIHLKQGIAQ